MAKGAYFITSSGSVAAPLEGSGKSYTVTVPAGAQAGQEYLVLTKDMNMPTDDNIVAGPAIVMVADNDYMPNDGYGHGWGGKWGGGWKSGGWKGGEQKNGGWNGGEHKERKHY